VAEVLKETNGSPQEAEKVVSDEDEEARISIWEVAELCEQLEKVCIVHSDANVLQLQGQLQKLHSHFKWLDTASLKQSSLNSFWSPVDVEMS
jgi:hypothetical protein